MLFAGLAVRDFTTARAWYERFFDRAADVVAHDHEVMWRISDRAWLYIVQDDAHAGNGSVAMSVPDISATVAALHTRGIEAGPIAREGDAGRKTVVVDPDGNSIAILQVASQ